MLAPTPGDHWRVSLVMPVPRPGRGHICAGTRRTLARNAAACSVPCSVPMCRRPILDRMQRAHACTCTCARVPAHAHGRRKLACKHTRTRDACAGADWTGRDVARARNGPQPSRRHAKSRCRCASPVQRRARRRPSAAGLVEATGTAGRLARRRDSVAPQSSALPERGTTRRWPCGAPRGTMIVAPTCFVCAQSSFCISRF